jgi:hypothetical protein
MDQLAVTLSVLGGLAFIGWIVLSAIQLRLLQVQRREEIEGQRTPTTRTSRRPGGAGRTSPPGRRASSTSARPVLRGTVLAPPDDVRRGQAAPGPSLT